MKNLKILTSVRYLTREKSTLRKTALWQLHKDLKATMGAFAGWDMPMIYKGVSIPDSVKWTRTECSIFDVSHMLQTRITGQNAISSIESVCTADIQNLSDNSGCLSLFTNDRGGIYDDLIVNRINENELYIVSNASMEDQDFGILSSATNAFDTKLEKIDTSLIAVQGPKAASILQNGTSEDLSDIFFMQGKTLSLFGIENIRLTRCGYTGEDGFELSVPSDHVTNLTEKLLTDGGKMAGLGARDTLRLEAGLCLYGNDIDQETLPPSAVLLFTVPKKRRADNNFPGCSQIVKQQKEKPAMKRVGFIFEDGKAPPRAGATIMLDGDTIGTVTSGGPSPSVGRNIGMGYVPLEYAKPGTELQVKVRKNQFSATVAKMPFVPCTYYSKK